MVFRVAGQIDQALARLIRCSGFDAADIQITVLKKVGVFETMGDYAVHGGYFGFGDLDNAAKSGKTQGVFGEYGKIGGA